MANAGSKEIEQTKRLMGALLRMPPKPHSDMKVGVTKLTKPKSRAASKRRAKNAS